MADSDAENGPLYQWNDISATGVQLVPDVAAGRNFQRLELGFSFPFYGREYSEVHVNASGFVTLGAPGSSIQGASYGNAMPTWDLPQHIIAPLAGKIDALAGGSVYVLDYGTYCIIQFENVPFHGVAGAATFQVVLKKDGSIFFYYKTISGPVDSGVVVGVQDDSQHGQTVAANEAM